MILYRDATIADLADVCEFTDWWLAGRGKRQGVSGALNDYFISPSQHRRYILKYRTYLALEKDRIVAWAVLESNSTLIHLLVAEPFRGRGIGRSVVGFLYPKLVRSKSNQSTGNPIGFYQTLGYTLVARLQSRSRFDIDKVRPGRKSIIDVLERGEPL